MKDKAGRVCLEWGDFWMISIFETVAWSAIPQSKIQNLKSKIG
jgi:hypothetical protein